MKVELLGNYDKNELINRIRKIATAGKLSRFPGTVFEAYESTEDFDKSLGLVKRIIGMGHKSIIEHDYLVFAMSNVSPIVEQTLIGYRLTSFTIKSRREVNFKNVGYYIPTFRNINREIHEKNDEITKKYISHMGYLFDTYQKLVDQGIDIEDARFILPYSYHSNLVMGLDARELEQIISALKYSYLSKISELKELGEILYNTAKEQLPYLIEGIDNHELNLKTGFEDLDKKISKPDIKIIPKTQLINYTKDADNTILLSYIMYHYQCPIETAEEILEKLDKNETMQTILHKNERRELEQVSFTFQIPISLAMLTHLTRHRMHSLLVPEFTPLWNMANFETPLNIKNNDTANKIFTEAANKNVNMLKEFKTYNIFEEDLIYFYLSAQQCNVITTLNGKSAQWICRMRCCTKTQSQTRIIANEFAKQIKEVAPLLGKGLGPTCVTDHICDEGKESCGLINKILENEK